MTDPTDIATRYLEVWNERDGARRRALIAGLWAKTPRSATRSPPATASPASTR